MLNIKPENLAASSNKQKAVNEQKGSGFYQYFTLHFSYTGIGLHTSLIQL
jgi:hypothetical protein